MDERIDALYDVDPSTFVTARDALAKALKAEGDAVAAKEVKALRRPTVAAAALNRIARDHPDEIDDLLEAGRALAGARGAALREAGRARRDAVQRLARRAPAAQRDAVAATLEAALVDAELATDLRAGRLTHEAEPPATFGFGAMPDTGADATPEPEPEPEVDVEALHREAAEAEAAVELAEAAARAARRALDDAEARLEAAKRRAADAAAALREVGS